MHIGKSLFVAFILIASTSVCVLLCIASIWNKCKSQNIRRLLPLFFFMLCISVLLCDRYWVYTNPNDQEIEFILYAEIEIPKEHSMQCAPTLDWHAAYEQFGLCQGSLYFDTNEKESAFGFIWPAMDFDNHTYIITYGKELISISYNVWERIDYPFRNGAKVGKVELGTSFNPNKIYVYEIPKIRIDNNI